MTYDKRWTVIARDWLSDSGVSDRLVEKYIPKLAQRLQDVAEEFSAVDIAQYEQEEAEAAYDAHINQKIDEARGK